MRFLITAILVGATAFWPGVAFGGFPPTTVKGLSDAAKSTTFDFQAPYSQYTKSSSTTAVLNSDYYNILKNPAFESSAVSDNWTAGGGVLAAATTTNIFHSKGATYNSNSASQTLTSDAITVPEGFKGQNCEASIQAKVPSGTATHLVQAWDGTNILASATIVNSVYFRQQTVNFPCPTSGTVALRIISVASDEPLIALDEAYLGLARNVGSTQLISEPVAYTPVYTGFGTVTNSTARSWRVGSYLFVESFFTIGTATAVEAQMTLGFEGTSGNVTTASNLPTLSIAGHCSGDTASATNFGNITVLQEASKTYIVFGRHTSGQSGLLKQNGNAFNNSVNVSCSFRVPIQGWAAQSLVMPNAQGWFAAGEISGANPSLGVASVTSYTEITSASLTLTPQSGSAPMGVMCSSTNAAATPSTSASTCSAGSESVGFNANFPTSGFYEVCAEFAHQAEVDSGEGLRATFQVIQTPTNAQTLTQEAGSKVTSGTTGMTIATGVQSAVNTPHTRCGFFNLSAGINGFRLMYEQIVGGTPNTSTLLADASVNEGQRAIRWSAKPVSQQQQAILANSVSSANTNGVIYNSAQVGSTGTVSKETGDWISGNCVVASAVATCTLVAGAFTTDPACVTTNFGETTNFNSTVTSASTSTVVVRTFDTANAASASAFAIHCSSPR